MTKDLFVGTYFTIVLTASICSLVRFRELKNAEKWVAYLLCTTLFFELLSVLAIELWKNNMYVYHIWSPIQLLLVCMYFNESVAAFKKYNIGVSIALVGFVVALANVFFLQPPDSLNSIFLLYESFCIIGLSLYSFFELAQKEKEIIANIHFWLTTIFLIYWSAVFMYWGMYHHLSTTLKHYFGPVTYTIWTINPLAYSGIALVFLLYRKMISTIG